MQNQEPVLLLGDVTGRSCVGVRMLTRVLEEKGRDVLALPTVLISNTWNLGRVEQLETTDYLLRTLKTWQELGLSFGGVYMGYVTGRAQAQALAGAADAARAQGKWVMVDPILGDHGRPYQSITDEQKRGMALLIEHAGLITPNLTEACLLTGTPYERALTDGRAAQAMAKQLSGGVRSVLITSAKVAAGRDAVAGWDHRLKQGFAVPFERVPGEHWGTGDRFCGVVLHELMEGTPLQEAVCQASREVCSALKAL